MSALIEECVALMMSAATRQGIAVQWRSTCPPRQWVWADRLRLKQILINLLSNAIKYNRRGGSVRVECAIQPPQRVRLTVIDSGRGIALDRQSELFTPFNRLGRETGPIEGSGIGLVITRRLVEMMGGDIGFESEPGRGSTFWVELAASPPKPESAPMAEPGPAPRPGGQSVIAREKTLLYIEDNPANLRLMQHVLASRPDLRLLACAEPAQGLELARDEHPDLILLDINLPGMSGYDILQILRERADTRATPVLAVSADAMPAAIERGLAAGFQAYLTKPLDLDHLLKEIDRLLSATPADGEERA